MFFSEGSPSICRVTGNITVAVPLDYELSDFTVLGVQVTDTLFSDFATVNVQVLDVNDNAPEFDRPEYR